MSQEAYTTYGQNIENKCKMLIDADLVEISNKKPKVTIYSIPSTRFAEELGRKIVANIVMLGFLTSITSVASLDSIKKSLLGSVPRGTEELNMSALMKGYDYGIELLDSTKSKKTNKTTKPNKPIKSNTSNKSTKKSK
jgi:2-oxoglutarate ferredoxin oxidoreductase subunit gamma